MQLKANLRDQRAIEEGVWVTVFDASTASGPDADNSMRVHARGYTDAWKRKIGQINARFAKAYQRADRAPAAVQHEAVVDALFDECILGVEGLKDGQKHLTVGEAHAICRELRGAPLFDLFSQAVQMVDARREADAEDLSGNSPTAFNGSSPGADTPKKQRTTQA